MLAITKKIFSDSKVIGISFGERSLIVNSIGKNATRIMLEAKPAEIFSA